MINRTEKSIAELSVQEREEILIDVAAILENTARDAIFVGNPNFALMSNNMAEAIRIHADELARDDIENAGRVLEQANSMISQFRAAHPHRVVSHAIHLAGHRMTASLEPAEYEIVQGAFKRLAQAPWFDRTSPNEKARAKLVLKRYSACVTNPVDLLAACEPEARQRYSIADADPTRTDLWNAAALRENNR